MKRSRPNADFKRSNTMSTQPSTPTTATSASVTTTTVTPGNSGGASNVQAPSQAPTVTSATPNTTPPQPLPFSLCLAVDNPQLVSHTYPRFRHA